MLYATSRVAVELGFSPHSNGHAFKHKSLVAAPIFLSSYVDNVVVRRSSSASFS